MRHAVVLAIAAVLTLPATSEARPGDLDETFSDDGIATVQGGTAQDLLVQLDGGIVVAQTEFDGTTFSSRVSKLREDGRPDPAFGLGGFVFSPLQDLQVAAGPGGSILIAGTTSASPRTIVVSRLLADGRPDAGFGSNGVVTVDLSGDPASLSELATDQSGRILIAANRFGSGGDSAVAIRLTANGGPDLTFSHDGTAEAGVGNPEFSTSDIVARPDGGLLLTGGAYAPAEKEDDVYLARFDESGELLDSFGEAGLATFDLGRGEQAGTAVVAPGGGYYVVASSCSGFLRGRECHAAVLRVSETGALDSAFGNGGFVTTAGRPATVPSVFDDGQPDMVLAGDGRATLPASPTERATSDAGALRLTQGGEPDPDFGDEGIAGADVDLVEDRPTEIELAPDGRIVVAGTRERPLDGGGTVVARLEAFPGPADADADQTLDEAERCPYRYGDASRGCPSIVRDISIRKGNGRAVRGELVAAPVKPTRPCTIGVRVVVKAKRRGPDERLKRVTSGRWGHWAAKIPRAATTRVYAMALRRTAPLVGRCARARSRTLK